MRPLLLIGCACCIAAGCATSDDPREGGLFGYLQHGPDGYQERLERRQAEVAGVEEQAKEDTRENQRLRTRLEERRVELADQQASLDALQADLAELEERTRTSEGATPESTRVLEELEREINSAQTHVQTLEGDTTLQIRERRRRIIELQRELKLLRERASLLTTL